MAFFGSYDDDTLRKLTGGKTVSPVLGFGKAEGDNTGRLNNNSGKFSISGSQTKYSVLIRNGHFALTGPGQQGTHIVKPCLLDFGNRKDSPENEHLTMQIANRVFNIVTAANALCFFEDGEPAYITKRYDIADDGTKIAQEDLASLGGVTSEKYGKDFKYTALSYEDLGHIIRRFIPSWRVEMVKFFDLILFNFLFSNGDAHLKNFSVLKSSDGDYKLSPAYDLMNTRIHLPDDSIFGLKKGLFSDGRTFPLELDHKAFSEFGLHLGLPEKVVKTELERFCADYPEIEDMVNRSFLSENVKEDYYKYYHYRLVSFLRA